MSDDLLDRADALLLRMLRHEVEELRSILLESLADHGPAEDCEDDCWSHRARGLLTQMGGDTK